MNISYKIPRKPFISSLLIVFLICLVLLFQNCSNIGLSKLKINELASVSCLDSNKNLTIVDISNTSVDEIKSGRTDFQIYQRAANNQLVVFTPEDSSTEWPPRWFKNGSLPADTDILKENNTVFSAILDDTKCDDDQVSAKFLVCGEEFTVSRNFTVGTCTPPPPPPPPVEDDGVVPVDVAAYCASIDKSYGMQIGGAVIRNLFDTNVNEILQIGPALNGDQGALFYALEFQINDTFQFGQFYYVTNNRNGELAPDYIAATISPCPGDFRTSAPANDPFFQSNCRVIPMSMETDKLTYRNANVTSEFNECKIQPNIKYYFNIQFLTSDNQIGCRNEYGEVEFTRPCQIRGHFK